MEKRLIEHGPLSQILPTVQQVQDCQLSYIVGQLGHRPHQRLHLLRQGVERPVDLGVVGVEVHPLHLVRGLPLGEPIILSLSACHKKSLLS